MNKEIKIIPEYRIKENKLAEKGLRNKLHLKEWWMSSPVISALKVLLHNEDTSAMRSVGPWSQLQWRSQGLPGWEEDQN